MSIEDLITACSVPDENYQNIRDALNSIFIDNPTSTTLGQQFDNIAVVDSDAPDPIPLLIFLVSEDDYDLVQKLLQLDANPNVYGDANVTPLIINAGNGNHAITSLLLQYGANPKLDDNSGFTALMTAADYGHLEVVETLLANQSGLSTINYRGMDNITAYSLARARNYTLIMDLLAQHGADTNVQDGKRKKKLSLRKKKISKKSHTKSKKSNDGAVYYAGYVPHRFKHHIPIDHIWNNNSFQIMAHEILGKSASTPIYNNLSYYIQKLGAKYIHHPPPQQQQRIITRYIFPPRRRIITRRIYYPRFKYRSSSSSSRPRLITSRRNRRQPSPPKRRTSTPQLAKLLKPHLPFLKRRTNSPPKRRTNSPPKRRTNSPPKRRLPFPSRRHTNTPQLAQFLKK
jgi:hypothetical protein